MTAAELLPAIRHGVLKIIELLGNADPNVGVAALTAVANLSEYREP